MQVILLLCVMVDKLMEKSKNAMMLHFQTFEINWFLAPQKFLNSYKIEQIDS
jgi:hypothetical protein